MPQKEDVLDSVGFSFDLIKRLLLVWYEAFSLITGVCICCPVTWAASVWRSHYPAVGEVPRYTSRCYRIGDRWRTEGWQQQRSLSTTYPGDGREKTWEPVARLDKRRGGGGQELRETTVQDGQKPDRASRKQHQLTKHGSIDPMCRSLIRFPERGPLRNTGTNQSMAINLAQIERTTDLSHFEEIP